MARRKPPVPKRPSYKILTFTTSQNFPIAAGGKRTGSAAMSADRANSAIGVFRLGDPVAIAASTLTLETEGTTRYAEWNVYLLLKS